MLDGISFGEFITVKRKQAKYTLKDFAKALSLSSTYLCNVERGKRSAPSRSVQVKMANVLCLNHIERQQMYDLAAKTKQRMTIPHDVLEYITNDENVIIFLRSAMQLNVDGIDLLQLIDRR